MKSINKYDGKDFKELSTSLNNLIGEDKLSTSWCKLDARLGILSATFSENDWMKHIAPAGNIIEERLKNPSFKYSNEPSTEYC